MYVQSLCTCLLAHLSLASLCFNALGGMPGVYVRPFLEAIGPSGLVNMLQAFPDKSAVAQCIVVFSAGQGAVPIPFVGTTHGRVVPPRGSTFG